jgi:hypothetical protein
MCTNVCNEMAGKARSWRYLLQLYKLITRQLKLLYLKSPSIYWSHGRVQYQ